MSNQQIKSYIFKNDTSGFFPKGRFDLLFRDKTYSVKKNNLLPSIWITNENINILEQKIIKTTFSLEEKYLKIWTLENDYEL